MTKKTLKDARETLKEVVKEFGPDHGTACTYTDNDGNPNCIAGHVFARWFPTQLHKLYGTFASNDFLYELMDYAAVKYIDKAQAVQDNRGGNVSWEFASDSEKEAMKWGRAYQAAESSLTVEELLKS